MCSRISTQSPLVRPQPEDRLFAIIFAVFLFDQGVSGEVPFRISGRSDLIRPSGTRFGENGVILAVQNGTNREEANSPSYQ